MSGFSEHLRFPAAIAQIVGEGSRFARKTAMLARWPFQYGDEPFAFGLPGNAIGRRIGWSLPACVHLRAFSPSAKRVLVAPVVRLEPGLERAAIGLVGLCGLAGLLDGSDALVLSYTPEHDEVLAACGFHFLYDRPHAAGVPRASLPGVEELPARFELRDGGLHAVACPDSEARREAFASFRSLAELLWVRPSGLGAGGAGGVGDAEGRFAALAGGNAGRRALGMGELAWADMLVRSWDSVEWGPVDESVARAIDCRRIWADLACGGSAWRWGEMLSKSPADISAARRELGVDAALEAYRQGVPVDDIVG